MEHKRPKVLYWYECKALQRHKLDEDCMPEVIVSDANGTRYRCRVRGGRNSHDYYGYASIKEAKADEIKQTQSKISEEQAWLGKLQSHTPDEKLLVFRQEWVESERGFGVRPDGYSLHVSLENVAAFVKDYNATLPEEVPDEYSRPYGSPATMEVSAEKFAEIQKSKNGIWGD